MVHGERVYLLHEAQAEVMRADARFKAAIAGTGGGKTALGPIWLLSEIHRVMGERDVWAEPIMGLIVAPTYQIMARATAPTLVTMLAGTDLEGRYVESKNRYYLPYGLGVIWMLSADSPLGLEGGQFDFCWIDEGGQLKYEAWIAIQGRLGQKQAPCLITTTPYGCNWLYHELFKRWLRGDDDYYVRQWSSKSNPAYPKAEYDRAKRSMSKERAAMRYDGQFVRLAGLVYPDLESCVVEASAPPKGKLVGGVDFGWNNPFSALGGTLYIDDKGRDVLYVWYERYKRHCTVDDHAVALPKGHMWWGDPSRPDSIAAIRKGGHKVRKAPNDIQLGIDAVNGRIYTQRLKISSACRAVIAEAEEYHYPEKDDQSVGEKPVDTFNHALDALRYLVFGMDKPKLGRKGRDDAKRNAA